MRTKATKSHSSPIKDPEFLDRLDQLAKEAERVRRLANHVAETTLSEASNPGEYLVDLADRALLQRICGKQNSASRFDKELELYWNFQRLIIAAQFDGFHFADVRAALAGVLLTLEQPADDSYWIFRESEAAHAPENSFGRAFALLSLLSVVGPRAEKQLTEEAQQRAANSKARLIADIVSRIPGTSGATPVLVLSVLKLVRRVDPKKFGELRDEIRRQEKDLVKDLAHLLLNADAPALDIARMARVLGGRYLNPGSQADPAQSELFNHAVRHILKSGNRNRDGSWETKDGKKTREPLAFVLDLPNSVLVQSISALADTVADALAALKRRLSAFEFTLPSNAYKKDASDHSEVNRAIYDGLMVSAAVADRLRDLLSDAVLDELGAAVPTNFVAWDELPNSLEFAENVNEGVIDLWKERSEKRPGAVLVFGPPGTGKTTIAKSLLVKLNAAMRAGPGEGTHEDWRFLALSPSDFARHGSDRIIASAERLFRKLQRVRRCVVLLDEMEEFLRVRGPGSSQESRLITTAFLPLLQETVNSREIILIVATNFVGTIDPAVTRRGRFDLILPLGPPDAPSRADIIAKEFKRTKPSITAHKPPATIDLRKKEHQKEIEEYTMGYTRAEILDYLNELRLVVSRFPARKELKKQVKKEVKSRVTAATLELAVDQKLKNMLKIELWRIRQERVPIALSGIPGCNWRSFRDEAARFKRGPKRPDDGSRAKKESKRKPKSQGEKYWKDPPMPDL